MKEFLKLIGGIVVLITIGCFCLFLIVSQPPSRVVYEKAVSGECVKVMVGDNNHPCSDFSSKELINSKVVFVDENYAFNVIVEMEE